MNEIRPDPNADAHGLCASDFELLERARQGDTAAFHELVDRHATGLYRLACALTGDRAEAEDVMQETFLGAFQGMRGFRGRSSVKTWLIGILNRRAARHHRRRMRHPALPLEGADRQPAARHAPEARIDVNEALGRLSPEHRQVLVLREVEGMTYAEMAQVLGVPLGTVESRLFRARQELKMQLADYLPSNG